MEIKIGNYELLDSAIVIGIENEPIEFLLHDNEGDMTLVVTFKKDSSIKGFPIRFNLIDNSKLEITLVNFDGFMGGGNSQPYRVGEFKNRALYFSYRVFDLENASKTLLFNFYLGEQDNGEK